MEEQFKKIAESIIYGLDNLDVNGWCNVIGKCSGCNGTGTVYEIQDGQRGKERCDVCGGAGTEYDTEKFRELKIELVLNHLRQLANKGR